MIIFLRNVPLSQSPWAYHSTMLYFLPCAWFTDFILQQVKREITEGVKGSDAKEDFLLLVFLQLQDLLSDRVGMLRMKKEVKLAPGFNTWVLNIRNIRWSD